MHKQLIVAKRVVGIKHYSSRKNIKLHPDIKAPVLLNLIAKICLKNTTKCLCFRFNFTKEKKSLIIIEKLIHYNILAEHFLEFTS